MKKLVLFLLSVLVLGVFALPAAAVPVTDLTALAGYFPEGSLMYAGVRTDDDFIATLDSVVERVGTALPEVSGISLTEVLDQAAASLKEDSTFAELFRPWLGDTAAAGLLPFDMAVADGAPIVRIVISITDREAAEGFFTANTTANDYEQTVYDGYTVYAYLHSGDGGDTHVLFTDDVMIISNDLTNLQAGGAVEFPLNEAAAFTNATGLLPESDYNVVYYQDSPALLTWAMDMNSAMGSMDDANMQAMGMVEDMMAALEPQAIGLTILDGGSLVIDGVSPFDPDAMAGMMNGAMNMSAPVDVSFIQHIPAGTPLVILGTGLGDSYGQLDEMLAMMEDMSGDSGMGFGSDSGDLQSGIFALNLIVRGVTGLDIDTILGAMNGTFAIYAGVNPAAEGADSIMELVSPDLLLDFAIAAQVNDPAVAATLSENLNATLADLPAEQAQNVDVSFEDINGTNTAVLNVPMGEGRNTQTLELLLGVNEDVFVFGTRRLVEAALNPGVGLDQDPQWQEAAQYFVPDAYGILYQSSDNFQPVVDLLEVESLINPGMTGTGMFFDTLTGLVNSSSITYGLYAENVSAFRAVLTLTGE